MDKMIPTFSSTEERQRLICHHLILIYLDVNEITKMYFQILIVYCCIMAKYIKIFEVLIFTYPPIRSKPLISAYKSRLNLPYNYVAVVLVGFM